MSNAFFVDQQTMESLISKGKTCIDGARLTVTGTGEAYLLTPAVKVLSCESSGKDPLKISDKFIPMSILESAGVDISPDTIILRNQSYHIDMGYICNPAELDGAVV
jgi:hypothetical protein